MNICVSTPLARADRVFGYSALYVGSDITLSTNLDVFLKLKMHSTSHCDSLWGPWVAILAFFHGVAKGILKQAQRRRPAAAASWTRGLSKITKWQTDKPAGP